MTKVKMSIHRGLAELKTLNSRINNAINAMQVVGVCSENGNVNGMYPEINFKANAKASFQSAVDLIARKTAIKTAIVLSNATTMVTIENIGEISIADAITYKETTREYKMDLLKELKRQANKANSNLIEHNSQIEANALEMAQTALGKDNVKLGDNDVMKVTGAYIKANQYTLVDPLNIEEQCKVIEAELLSFDVEIDAILSESNALTMIEV